MQRGDENWTGYCGLCPEDRDRLFILLRAAHVPVFKGGDVVIANSMDFVMLREILECARVERVPGRFRAVAFSDAEVAEFEQKLSADKDAQFEGHDGT